jgi:hypothetical protein
MFARMVRMKNNQLSLIDYNHHGMRGKFTIPCFVGSYDREEYFDQKMDVQQEFNSQLVS